MLTLSKTEHKLASEIVDEFSRLCLGGASAQYQCVYRSHGFPDTRLVLKVEALAQSYAIKIDRLSPETGRLNKEFDALDQLHSYFKNQSTNSVVRPVYLSADETFMVTKFIDRPTAVDFIYNSKDSKQVAQVFRRAGSWLHGLHGFQEHRDYPFKPRWMTESINNQIKSVPPNIADISRPMIEVFMHEAERLRNRVDTRVYSHGDFHGLNLIMGQGVTIGLDFTEARDKLAVYDIVDFLKADIFRDGSAADIDRSGILKRNKEMFFRQYRHPIDMEILDCCVRGRLLKDWLQLWQTDHDPSPFEQNKRKHLELRLKQAFKQTIT